MEGLLKSQNLSINIRTADKNYYFKKIYEKQQRYFYK